MVAWRVMFLSLASQVLGSTCLRAARRAIFAVIRKMLFGVFVGLESFVIIYIGRKGLFFV